MATSGKGTATVGYNVQIAVDAEHHLIVAHEMTNQGYDRGSRLDADHPENGVLIPCRFTYRLSLRRQHLFVKGSGVHRGAEQGLRARQRLGAENRTSFLPRLGHLGVLVRGVPPGPCRYRFWHVRRPVALADSIGVGDDAASVGDVRSPSRSVYRPIADRI